MQAIVASSLCLALVACGSGSTAEPGSLGPGVTSSSSGEAAAVVPAEAPAASMPGPRDPDQPLLVELFTSQGCHSCPSADRVLSQLGDHGLAALDESRPRSIIPLAFHIDYWNYIGWTDPYSSERWTDRQRAYARKLANGRVYTPQLVIHGRAETVGSRSARIIEAIDDISPKLPVPAEVRVRATGETVESARAAVRAAVSVSFAETRPSGPLEVWVALYQNRVRTQVPRGENAGKTLYNDHIVLDFKRAFVMPEVKATDVQNAAGNEPRGAGGEVSFDLAANAAENDRNLGVVAFVQDPSTLAIHGVSTASL